MPPTAVKASSSPKRRDISYILSPASSACASGSSVLMRSVATACSGSPPPPKVCITKYTRAHSGMKMTAGKMYLGCLKLTLIMFSVVIDEFYNVLQPLVLPDNPQGVTVRFRGMAIRESSSRRMARPLSASSCIVARCRPLFDCMVRKPWNRGSMLAMAPMPCALSVPSGLLLFMTREHTSKSDNVPVTQAKVLFGCFRAQMFARRMRPTKRSLSPAFPNLGCSHARICRCVLRRLSRSFFLILISILFLIIQSLFQASSSW